MLGSMALAPLLIWKVSELREKKTFFISLAVSLLITGVSIVLGLTKPISIVLVFLSMLVVMINSLVIFRMIRKMPAKTGAYLSHVGIGFMIIGIITSSMYNQSEKVTLPLGEYQTTRFGYDIQFVDFEERSDGKDRVKLVVKKQDGTYEADPQFYYSEYTQSYMLGPHVKVGINKDIYISPISYMPGQTNNDRQVELRKNEPVSLDNLKFTFNQFVVGDHMDQSPMTVRTDITVSVSDGNYSKDITIQPALWMEDGKLQGNDLQIPDTDYQVHVQSIDANEGIVILAVHGGPVDTEAPKDILAVEVSEKPLISILWLGCIVLLFGMSVSLIDVIKKASKA
jgi:cytochrome c-type biogenesis protein CcmF